jgi:hypothetical protein
MHLSLKGRGGGFQKSLSIHRLLSFRLLPLFHFISPSSRLWRRAGIPGKERRSKDSGVWLVIFWNANSSSGSSLRVSAARIKNLGFRLFYPASCIVSCPWVSLLATRRLGRYLLRDLGFRGCRPGSDSDKQVA